MITIGFDVSQTGEIKAGCGYFADSLIQHIALANKKNRYILYPTFGDHFWDNDHHKTRKIHSTHFSQSDLKHTHLEQAKQFWQRSPNDLEQMLGFVDILHSNNFFCPPKIPKTKLVYTLYDLSFVENPEYTTEANRIACFNGVFNASLRADHIIAISDYSKQSFLNTFPHFSEENISIIYPSSRYHTADNTPSPSQKISHLTPDHFWLCVGTLEPRKNHTRLLQAYAKLKAEQKQALPLVLAGTKGWMMDDFNKTLNDLNLQDDVQLLGYVDEAELQWLYTHCFCMVYPSLFEGFGMPVLEAMSLGAAVITSQITSIPEIVGSAGIMIDPYNIDAIFKAMLKLATDASYHQTLKSQAQEQSKKFSWDQSARELLEIYTQLAG